MVSATAMINKPNEIRKLFKQNKTTREIAHELRVSLRDIAEVRKQENIDIGALERQQTRLKEDIATLDSMFTRRRSATDQLQEQINNLRQTKANLEAAMEKKQTEIKYVKEPVEPIYFPENYDEVRKYLETLSLNQLDSLRKMVVDIINDRLVLRLQDIRRGMRKETEDKINRMRNSLRS